MRNYGKVLPQFWTGPTGRAIRECGHQTMIIALYLVTCPTASWLGLYYLSFPALCHETGSSSEGALEGLKNLAALGFAHYDYDSECVWVPEMARIQILRIGTDALEASDNRVKGIKRDVESERNSPFFNAFLDKYAASFHLQDVPRNEGASKPLERPLEAPPKPRARASSRALAGASSGARAFRSQTTRAGGASTALTPVASNGTGRGVEDFLALYPNKRAKEYARKAWKKLNPDSALVEVIFAAVEKQKQSPDWLKEDGKYVPMPGSWLNGRRWEDEIRSASTVFSDVTQRNIRAAQNVLDRIEGGSGG